MRNGLLSFVGVEKASEEKWGMENELSHQVIGAAIEVHRTMGPGLLESVYEECLSAELAHRRVSFRRQVPVALRYRGKSVGAELKIDLIVQESLILELKAAETILPIHEAQLLTYLRLTNKRFGLLINFNVAVLKDGVKRMANGWGSTPMNGMRC